MISILLTYSLVGAVAGVLAGLLGIGGGLVIVPMLVFCFEWQDIADSVRDCAEEAKGRCIISAGCEITPGTSVENMKAFSRTSAV